MIDTSKFHSFTKVYEWALLSVNLTPVARQLAENLAHIQKTKTKKKSWLNWVFNVVSKINVTCILNVFFVLNSPTASLICQSMQIVKDTYRSGTLIASSGRQRRKLNILARADLPLFKQNTMLLLFPKI